MMMIESNILTPFPSDGQNVKETDNYIDTDKDKEIDKDINKDRTKTKKG